MKELQAKYKDDKQRQQQEMMKFYQENKVNPFASCLPLVLQLPVFISLFYMLRKDLQARHLPGHPDAAQQARASPTRPCEQVDRGVGEFLVHPGPDRQGDGRRPDRPDRALRRLAAASRAC